MTPEEAARALQVDPGACPQVVEAAFTVLRELVLSDAADDAPRRLADLNRAHRVLAAGREMGPHEGR